MRAGSWRMVVARDRWVGDVRHVEAIAELRDVTIVGAQEPAYGAAAIVEFRTSIGGSRRQEGAIVDPKDTGANTVENENENETETETEERTESATEATEQRSSGETSSAGSLNVEQQRSSSPRRGLADEFRSRGFPGEVASVPWEVYENRAVTWSPSINLLNQPERQGGPLPHDSRYAWTALERVPVDEAVTSVSVLVSLSSEAATGVVRPISSTANKAEVSSTVDLQTVALSQVAAVETGIPNVVLAQPAIDSIIQVDLRNAVNDGLDGIVVDTFSGSAFQAPGSDPLPTSIRKAMTVLMDDGYLPDTVILTPADAEDLDTLVTGLSGGDADYVFGAGNFASGIYGLRKVISSAAPSSVVLDSRAYAKIYASPVRLATFEENSGRTNSATARLELHAACGVERQDSAVRLAAS